MNRFPNTPRLVGILENATDEAARLGHYWTGVEHVALSIAADPHATPTLALNRLGISAEQYRQAIMAELEALGDTAKQ